MTRNRKAHTPFLERKFDPNWLWGMCGAGLPSTSSHATRGTCPAGPREPAPRGLKEPRALGRRYPPVGRMRRDMGVEIIKDGSQMMPGPLWGRGLGAYLGPFVKGIHFHMWTPPRVFPRSSKGQFQAITIFLIHSGPSWGSWGSSLGDPGGTHFRLWTPPRTLRRSPRK